MYNCIFCQSPQHTFQYDTHDIRQKNYKVHKCDNCSTYFLCPPPSPADLAWAYSDEYYGNQQHKFDGDVEGVVDMFRQIRAKWVSKRLPSGAKVLDIGCGNGRFLHFLTQINNIEGYGIELAGKSAERAAKLEHIKMHIGTLLPDTFAPNSFDAITLVHVFEHLPNPAEILQTIQKILKPQGKLFIYLPNIDSFQSRFFKGLWLHLDPPRHLFLMPPQALVQNLAQFNLRCVEQQFFSPEYNPFGTQQSLLNLFYAKRELLYEHLKGNTEYSLTYSKWHLWWQIAFFRLTFPLFIVLDGIAALFKKSGTFVFVFEHDKDL
jgi:2-polyprenyl-3-methyl-5-hydroxy-6-metoxy-1,4-benzoquinol methylase